MSSATERRIRRSPTRSRPVHEPLVVLRRDTAPPLVPRSNRQRAAEQTRQAVVAAARQLFRERGFERATTTDIAAAAGVAKGTLFLHARTKERLLIMVYEDEFRQAIEEAFGHPPKNQPIDKTLATVLGRFFKVYERDLPLARHFVREVQFICRDEAEGMCRVTDDTMAGIARIIQEHKDRGDIAADIDPVLAAANSFMLYYGILTAWLCGWLTEPARRDQALAASLALHWRGLDRDTTHAPSRSRRLPRGRH